jgi:Flp pilus assembly protein TadD
MDTRDLLLLLGFLRGGTMFPVAVLERSLPADRSLRALYAALAEQERTLFGGPPLPIPSAPASADEPTSSVQQIDVEGIRQRVAMTAWSGDFLAAKTPISDVPDPGVVLCLLYDVPAAEAGLPIDVFAQTLRRYALRDPSLRTKFDDHVQRAGTYVPPWLSPEARRQRSQEAFDRAMRVAREQGFAAAAPLFEGVRGDCFAPAQIAVAVYEMRELGDTESALGRLDEVVRIAPRNVAARMQRAQLLMQDPGRRVEAASDWLAVLRSLSGPEAGEPSPEVRQAAMDGLWALCREFASPRKLEAAAALAKHDLDRGFEAVSRYVHTHPCTWDAQVLLASLALARQSFDLTIKLLSGVRWLFPDDPNPHFVYGQALASKGNVEAAAQALGHAARLAPNDAEIREWLAFVNKRLAADARDAAAQGVKLAHHVTRTLLLLVGFVRAGRVLPAALTLHRVPGDVSLALVVQALAGQEQRRFGEGVSVTTTRSEEEVTAVSRRTILLDHGGGRLDVEHLAGDVPDPGVLIALLYDSVVAGADGRPDPHPPPGECRATLLSMARADTEIAAKLDRHLQSPDAALLSRLDLAR